MTSRQTSQYEMFVWVRKFGNAYREMFPDGSLGAVALSTINTAIGQLETSATSKHQTMKSGMVEKALAKRALRDQIGAVAKTARIVARTVPGADSHFQLPPRQTDLAVLTAARAFLHEAQSMKDTMIRCGLPDTFIDDLQQATDAFAVAVEGRINGRSRSSNVKSTIRIVLSQAMEAVTALDVIVVNVLGKNPTAMDDWKKARRVRVAAASSQSAPDTVPVVPQAQPAEPQAAVAPLAPTSAGDDPLRRAS